MITALDIASSRSFMKKMRFLFCRLKDQFLQNVSRRVSYLSYFYVHKTVFLKLKPKNKLHLSVYYYSVMRQSICKCFY